METTHRSERRTSLTAHRRAGLGSFAFALVLAWGLAWPTKAAAQFTTDFDAESCTFAASGRQNPYWSLTPGDRVVLEGDDDGEAVRVEITVLNETRQVRWLTPEGMPLATVARVVEEREFKDGELAEVSRNWFARCRQTNDIFYFGEDVDNYEDGVIVNHNGSWEAGVAGGQPGILIPARFLLGARYFQELAPGVALDRGRNHRMGLSVTGGGATFSSCVEVIETSPLEPGSESLKVYCPGVGLVRDDSITLVEFDRD